MPQYNVLPLFPSALYSSKVEENMDDYFEIIKSKYEYTKAVPTPYSSYISKSLNVLNDIPDLKAIIMRYFNHFKNDVLKYHTTEFSVTTSWATKTVKGTMSELHSHTNCMYSGVLYLSDHLNASPIEFINNYKAAIKVNDPAEWNIFNSQSWKVVPEKNLLIIFPSTLHHRIIYQEADVERYSLAFNIMPIGEIGGGDSSVNLSLSSVSNQRITNNS